MNGISLLIAITRREYAEQFTSFFHEQGIHAVFSLLCRGTAGQSVLDLLGLEKTEKTMLWTMLEKRKADRIMQKMISSLGINMPGEGIALCVPVGSIGGASSMRYLLENQNIIIGEVTNMEEKPSFPYELIVATVENGSVDMVMEAARSAGAGGGTVIHAKGTDTDFTQKFFGVSLAKEREVILIVAKRKDKQAIMRAIMEKAGMCSEAHTALFSLPVENVAGLTSVMEGEEDSAGSEA